jgi:flagellar biosynthesis protein FlhB
VAEQGQDQEREDLSEEASPYRLEKFRREGKVARAANFLALSLFLHQGSFSISLWLSMVLTYWSI